jgi:photoactive yellow protein
MNAIAAPSFHGESLHADLALAAGAALDELPFGIIGFDATWRVRRYNAIESRFSGLSLDRVLGHDVFGVIAPCLDNALVAGRFREAIAQGAVLDATLDYVLTWRMAPTPVQLRLLHSPGEPLRYVVVQHAAPARA